MEEKLEQLLSDYATVEDKEEKAKICLDICRITRDMGQFEKSRKYGEEALELATEASFKVKALLAIGIGYGKQGRYDNAEGYFLKALEIAQTEENTSDLAYIYQNLSFVESGRLNMKKYFECLTKAAHYSELNEDFAQLANIYVSIGSYYLYSENYNMAVDYYKKSLKIAKTAKQKASIQYGIADVYFRMKNYDGAFDRAERALKVFIKEKDVTDMTSSYVLLGFICLGKGDHIAALEYANKALDVSEKNEIIGHYLYTLMLKAAICMETNDMDKANDSFDRFLELANEETADEETMMDFYGSYATYHEKLGNVAESEIYKAKQQALQEKYKETE